jgi:hypothetical protein
VKFIEHRIADRRVVRLIQKWLNAGVLEDGKRTLVQEGTPQGGCASPLLANIYLHYAFDLWVQAWRKKRAHGDVIVVRFADDIVLGFQSEMDAKSFRGELEERFRKFKLELHPDKTRLIEFGPFAADNRRRRGEGKPETFAFLGFTHICAKKRSNGRFTVLRQTIRKRLQAKLSEVKAELRRRMHDPIPEQGRWLHSVVGGHIRYYGVPMNSPALIIFRFQAAISGIAPCRDAVRLAVSLGPGCIGSSTAGRLPHAPVTPIPCAALASSPEARAGCGKAARPDLCRGLCAIMVPTATILTARTLGSTVPCLRACVGRSHLLGGCASSLPRHPRLAQAV